MSSGAYCHTDENSDRVGEFAIGTNIAIRDVIGNILQDEKIPGVHIAFGNPYAVHTGADWYLRRISMSSDATSTSGSTVQKSWIVERSCLIASRRQQFNRSWTAGKFARFRAILESECGEDNPSVIARRPASFRLT